MPDLEQLLAEDARRWSASDEPGSDIRSALDQTFSHIRRRRRHRVIAGAAFVAAVTVAGTLIAPMTGSTPQAEPGIGLAADYRVIAPVPGHADSFYAIGPSARTHPDNCQAVPHVSVTITNFHGGFSMVIAPAPGYRIPPGVDGQSSIPHRNPFSRAALATGQYDLFICQSE